MVMRRALYCLLLATLWCAGMLATIWWGLGHGRNGLLMAGFPIAAIATVALVEELMELWGSRSAAPKDFVRRSSHCSPVAPLDISLFRPHIAPPAPGKAESGEQS